ncbi:hypothetical protein B0H14DRAFT_3495484 [Mycena olivaceomarginata]|nr:hypothetical protein B0H14DRAFT_3495484 [Mycena olivaceomarginata]
MESRPTANYFDLPVRTRSPIGSPPKQHTYQEFGYLTALAARSHLSTQSWACRTTSFQAVRLGFVPCPDCGRIRTVHAHIAPRPDGRCEDVGPHHSSYICINQNTLTEIGPNGQRCLTIPEA